MVIKIVQVWNHNIDFALKKIRKLINRYNYIALDTEFPGIVAKPILQVRPPNEYQYQILRCNVDLLQIIQLGIALSNEEGKIPLNQNCWQFNFHFNFEYDMFAQDSIDLLKKSGVNFQDHREKGIELCHFANLLIKSGLIMNNEIKWISFHSGYDFGYLVKILTREPLPFVRRKFFELLRIYFPCIYDMKYLNICYQKLHGGLNRVAEKLNIIRVGQVHQAGSDSLLTLKIFFRLKKTLFRENLNIKYRGLLYGLGTSNQEKRRNGNYIFEQNIDQGLPVILL